MFKYLILCLLASSLVFSSCGGEENGLTVSEYIAQNNLTTTELDEGVHIIIDNPGDADRPSLDRSFTIKYVGMLTDGRVFDSNSDGFEGLLRNMIRGWQIGIREFGRGGSGTLIIPSNKGYGSQGAGTIPPNSTLIFDVEVVDFE